MASLLVNKRTVKRKETISVGIGLSGSNPYYEERVKITPGENDLIIDTIKQLEEENYQDVTPIERSKRAP